jgi:hypothetical protein
MVNPRGAYMNLGDCVESQIDLDYAVDVWTFKYLLALREVYLPIAELGVNRNEHYRF